MLILIHGTYSTNQVYTEIPLAIPLPYDMDSHIENRVYFKLVDQKQVTITSVSIPRGKGGSADMLAEHISQFSISGMVFYAFWQHIQDDCDINMTIWI